MSVKDAIDPILRAATEAGEVPGVVALAATAGGPVYEGAFGKRDITQPDAMTEDSLFWIASMTKAVTSVAAMQLVERGKLALDAPIAEVLPELAGRQVLEGFAADGTPKLRAARRPITLRHLLTHTAGFSYEMWSADMQRYVATTGTPSITTCRKAALDLPLLFDPGERWEYGINIDFIGRAVEAVSGQSLEDYFRQHIFTPLGMLDAGFLPNAAQRARTAQMHARLPGGSLAPIPFGMPEAPEFFMGGGGLYATGRDYLAFIRMLLHQGRLGEAEILRPETVALMAQNQIGTLQAGVMHSVAPQASNDVDFFPGMAQRWGLGFLINTEASPHGRAAGSLAWAGLGNCYFWIDPHSRVCGVILTQILPFADAGAVGLYQRFESALYRGLKS